MLITIMLIRLHILKFSTELAVILEHLLSPNLIISLTSLTRSVGWKFMSASATKTYRYPRNSLQC